MGKLDKLRRFIKQEIKDNDLENECVSDDFALGQLVAFELVIRLIDLMDDEEEDNE